MAIHSSILAWRIPWTEEPGRLQSMGSQRVGHDWETNARLLQSLALHLGLEFIMSLILCMVIGGVLVSDLENSMVSILHGVVKSQTRLTDFSLHDALPIWRIPWTEEPGRLQSMGSQRVGHD